MVLGVIVRTSVTGERALRVIAMCEPSPHRFGRTARADDHP